MVVSAALCFALMGVSARSTKKSLPKQETPVIQVRNYTKAFEIVSTEAVGETYVVTLRNASEKAISAYTWSLGPGNRPTYSEDTDAAISGQFINAGAIYKVQIPLIAFLHSAETTPSHQSILNFVAVLFDDQSGEGFPQRIAILKDRRIGERLQLKRIKQLLTAAAADSESLSRLNNLKASISALPETAGDGKSDAVNEGLLSAKRHTLVLLDHLTTEHGGINKLSGPDRDVHARRILNNLIEQASTWLARY